MQCEVLIGGDRARSFTLEIQNLVVSTNQDIIVCANTRVGITSKPSTIKMLLSAEIREAVGDLILSSITDQRPYYRRFNKSRF